MLLICTQGFLFVKTEDLTGPLRNIVKRPIFVIFMVGIIARVILMPLFSNTYDVWHWAITVQHIQAGEGLYSITGYWYTPVWGYILGAWSNVMDLFGVTDYGYLVENALVMEHEGWIGHTATVPSMAFAFFVKIPEVIADIIAAYLIYKIVMHKTNDEKKATYAFALWFLCPFVIFVSAVHGMFDPIVVMFMLLSIYAVMKGHNFLAGASLSVAILLKIFPIFIVPAMIAYLASKHRGDSGAFRKQLGTAALGAGLMALLIYIPQILDGTVAETLRFLTGRMDIEGLREAGSVWDLVNLIGARIGVFIQPVLFIAAAFLAYRMYKKNGEDADKALISCLLITFSVVFIIPMTPQYLLILFPFMVLFTVMYDKRFLLPFLLISFAVMAQSILTWNATYLIPLAAETNILNTDVLISFAREMNGLLFNASWASVLLAVPWVAAIGGALLSAYYWMMHEKGVREDV